MRAELRSEDGRLSVPVSRSAELWRRLRLTECQLLESNVPRSVANARQLRELCWSSGCGDKTSDYHQHHCHQVFAGWEDAEWEEGEYAMLFHGGVDRY